MGSYYNTLMNYFLITLITVAGMLLFAIPGFLLVRFKAIKPDAIKAFSKVLMIVCQPALTIYSFQKVARSAENSIRICESFLVAALFMIVISAIMLLILRKKLDQVYYRVASVCASFGNVAFLGIPIIEAALPDFPEGAMVCAVFVTVMNILGWSLGSFVITRDKRYVSASKILLNPATLGFAVALILYFCDFRFTSIPYIGETVNNIFVILARMSTALCMMILGMRLATVKPRGLFLNYKNYIVVFVKQIAAPFLLFGILYLIPIDKSLKTTLVILSAAPIAQVVQNFTEMIGEGEEEAADLVLLGTILSLGTIPLVTLVL
jgi:predicted permease